MRLLALVGGACVAFARPAHGQGVLIRADTESRFSADTVSRLSVQAMLQLPTDTVSRLPKQSMLRISTDTMSELKRDSLSGLSKQSMLRVRPDTVVAGLARDVVPVAGVTAAPVGVLAPPTSTLPGSGFRAEQDTVRRRAVQYSEWYSRRLTIHRYGSYTMLPLFVTQFVLGTRLLGQKEDLYAGTRLTPIDDRLRTTHAVVAGAVGTLFVVNTTTGLWNLFESRHNAEGRTRRTVHALTMLAADAGFAYTGVLGSRTTDRGPPQGRRHRNTALASFTVATAGASLMWFAR